jgi:hypothetical protein
LTPAAAKSKKCALPTVGKDVHGDVTFFAVKALRARMIKPVVNEKASSHIQVLVQNKLSSVGCLILLNISIEIPFLLFGMNSAQLRLLSDLREMKMDVAGESVLIFLNLCLNLPF